MKFFQKTVTNYSAGNASGFNMDFGTQFDITRDILFAAKLQNFLVGSEGNSSIGTISWDTGEVETIDSSLILGVANKTLYRNVLLGLDLKKSLTRQDYPWVFRLGMEWHPHDVLFFRLGMDQKMDAPDVSDGGDSLGVLNSYTLGLGINLYGWRFDYAYRPNGEIKDLTSHVLSIAYVGAEPAEKLPANLETELVTASTLMRLYEPEDHLVTNAATVIAKGRINRGNIYILNEEEYELAGRGKKFSKEIILALGINDVTLGIPGVNQKLVHKVLRLAKFKDINRSQHKNSIVYLATLDYIKGDYPEKFNPTRYVTRSEMASLIVKIHRFLVPLSMKGIWEDIDILASQGILKGFPDGLIKGEEKLTKAQVAMVLSRLQGLSTKTKTKAEYSYLLKEHWAQGAIQALVNTKLYTMEDFTPRSTYVTKEQLVDLFSRLPFVQKTIKNLLDFDESGVDNDYSQEIDTLFLRRSAKEEENVNSDMEMFNELVSSDTQGVQTPGVINANPSADDFKYNEIMLEETKASVVTQNTIKPLPSITMYTPKDRTVVYNKYLKVKGAVGNSIKVYVNGVVAPITKSEFIKTIALKPGKNLVVVKAFNANGKYKRIAKKVLYLKTYSDIKDSDPYRKTLGAMITLGYVGGRGTKFYPNQKLTKVQYATFINKIYGYKVPVTSSKAFKDLSSSHWGYRNAYMLHKKGYLKAKNGFYKPNEYITRAFGVVVLTRTEKIKTLLESANAKPYSDVTSKVWANKHISAAKKAGLITP
ncbi:S-layer homology domain-containing protein, partial [bacterium]|nr:S-layer homology domain-containing protein [bacterium]